MKNSTVELELCKSTSMQWWVQKVQVSATSWDSNSQAVHVVRFWILRDCPPHLPESPGKTLKMTQTDKLKGQRDLSWSTVSKTIESTKFQPVWTCLYKPCSALSWVKIRSVKLSFSKARSFILRIIASCNAKEYRDMASWFSQTVFQCQKTIIGYNRSHWKVLKSTRLCRFCSVDSVLRLLHEGINDWKQQAAKVFLWLGAAPLDRLDQSFQAGFCLRHQLPMWKLWP